MKGKLSGSWGEEFFGGNTDGKQTPAIAGEEGEREAPDDETESRWTAKEFYFSPDIEGSS